MLPTNYSEALDFVSHFFHFDTSLTHTLDYLRESIDHLVADLAFVLIGYVTVCVVLYKLICSRFGRFLIKPNRFPDNPRRVLLVTAHPDDECMFFGPTVLALLREPNCRVFVLCLSNGYSKRIGRQRRLEVIKACEVLGIGAGDVTVMNMTCLQDDPKVEWKVEIMAPVILRQIETLDIDLLLTFDKDGVSQHPHHCAIFYAAASLCLANLLPKSCRVLTLESVNIFRKYISLFDLPLSIVLSTNWSIINWTDRRRVQNAMRQHKSQFVWFRRLYVTFSRYMLLNSLREVTSDEVEFEILET